MGTTFRKYFQLIPILLIFFADAGQVCAAHETVFGPKDFKIKRWHTLFSARGINAGEPGEGVIVIAKTRPDKEISGGFVYFNEKIIPLGHFFKGRAHVLEREVKFTRHNRLIVFMLGGRHACIRVEVKRKGRRPVNRTPVAEAQSVTTSEDTSTTITLTGSDPEDDSLAYSIASEPIHGSLSGEVPNLIYTPDPDYNGLDAFTFTVGDGASMSEAAAVSIKVTPVNDPPTAENDSLTTYQTMQVTTGNMLSNDKDVDGDILTISGYTQPAHGSVKENGGGTFIYTPDAEFHGTDSFTYTISDGNGGGATATVSITVISPITLEITSPLDGALVPRPDVMVEGRFANAADKETAVVVNGILATIYDDRFMANHVPLLEGQTDILAVAPDVDGCIAKDTIGVNAQTSEDYIVLTANTESGIAPLEVTFDIEASFVIRESALTYSGPGQVQYLGSSRDAYKVRISTEGIYTFTAEVKVSQDQFYSDTVVVGVLTGAALDTLLKAKWNGVRGALEQKNIDKAVSFFEESSQNAYRETFAVLSDSLPQIARDLGDVQFIRMMEDSAEYDLRTTRGGKEYSFYVLFVRDKNGIWKIRSF